MAAGKKYYKLDEVGVLGKQERLSTQARALQIKKTGDAIRKLRMGRPVAMAAATRSKKAS